MKIHFIAIGGIGVSALARYYLEKDHKISGSDLASSEITKSLKKSGVKIFIGQKKENISKNLDLVIYSSAVKSDNPELKEVKRLKIKHQSYPEALGELSKKYFTIAVSGTHGKSTTTSMLGLLLIKAGLDPTVIVGTKLKEFNNSNFRMGRSKYLVIEACEHEESFLNYYPEIIVLTNIEEEHLDYYKNLKNILKAFKKFISNLLDNGYLVVNKDDRNILRVIKSYSRKPIYYSLKNKEARKLKKLLKVPGEHNIYNALAALTVARILKIPDKISFKALSEYKGCWRRFEIIKTKSYTLISDYGHHPTEIKATLKAIKEKYSQKEIWFIFQPHQYKRTFYLFNDFVKVFRTIPVNRLIITNIFDVAGREDRNIKKKVSSEKIVKEIKKPWAIYLSTLEKTKKYLKKNLKGGEVVIIMGAGDIYKLAEDFST